jgi:hypothetical protein
LWLLVGLQLGGRLRYLWRSLRTVKGALLAVVGLGVFAGWLLLVFLMPTSRGVDPEAVLRYGPGLLLLYCLTNVLMSGSERAVYFTPAEVNFLFPGPFRRRTLLLYKVVSALLIGLPTTLLMLAFLHAYATWLVAAYVALVLMFVFLQLVGMAINLLATTLGTRLYSRGRKALLGAVVAGVVLALLQAGVLPPSQSARDYFDQVADTGVWKAISVPLRWFFDAFLAQRLWPDLAVSAGLALLVDLALLGLVLALDANYLESSAAVSARLYERLQRLRRAGLAGEGSPAAMGRLSLPAVPYWGGIGPHLWRQMTTAMRGMGRFLFALAVIGLLIVAPLMSTDPRTSGNMAVSLAAVLLLLTVFLTTLVPFDFRGDVDRMALLKTLPVPAWRLAVGQLLTPVLLLSLVQWVVLAVAYPLSRDDPAWLLLMAAYALPFNFLQLALDNLLFLLFPTRLVANTPGDFQVVGRIALLMLAKVLGLAVVVGMWFAVYYLALLLTNYNEAATVAAAAGWPVLALSGAALVPLLGWAFRAFDVGRDTPA